MPKDSAKDEPESSTGPYGPGAPAEKNVVGKTAAAKTPAAKAPAAKTDAAKIPAAKTPANKTPANKARVPEATKAASETSAPVVAPIVTPPAGLPPAPPAPWTATAPPPAYAPPAYAPPAYTAAAPVPYGVGAPAPTRTLSLLSMIFGIVGLVVSCCYGAGILFGIAGIVLGHLGRKRESAQGMALTGIITGYACAALSVVMWVLLFLLALSPLLLLPFLPAMSNY